MALFHPEGASINDGVPPDRCSLRYPSVDYAVCIIHTLGRGTQLAKWISRMPIQDGACSPMQWIESC